MNNTTLFGRNNVRLTLLTNLLDCHDLSGQSGHLGFEAGNLDFARCILTLCAGIFKSLGSLGLVEVIAADGRISQHSHQIGLNFKHATSHKHLFHFLLARQMNANKTGADQRDEGHVPRQNTQFARLTGQRNELGVTGEDGLFRANASTLIVTMLVAPLSGA